MTASATHSASSHPGAGSVATPEGGWSGPLFVVGMPRSGTKLLRGLLTQHARIRIPDIETDFLPFLVRWVRERGEPVTEAAFERLFAALKGATYFTYRARHNPPFSWQSWRRECDGHYAAAGLFDGFMRYETGCSRASGVIWGDKSPAYVRHIALLLEHFPTARIVHIVRDVRDYCVSINNAWHKDMRRAAHEWARDVGAAHRLCRAHPARCIELTYEDLLRAPEATMDRLGAFLGLDFERTAALRLERPVEARGDAAGRTEIVRDNFRKFAERLTPRRIRRIESLAYDTMVLLGYQPMYAVRQKRMSGTEQRLLRVKDGVWLLARSARKHGVAGALRFHLSHARVVG